MRYYRVFLLLITLSFCLPKLTLACMPSGDPWFLVRIEIDNNTLPAGIRFDTGAGDGRNEFGKFINTTDTPFFLVEPKPVHITQDPRIPEGYLALHEFNKNNSYHYSSYGPKGSEAWKRFPYADPRTGTIGWPEIDANKISFTIPEEDHRPKNFTIPSPQPLTMLAAYNSKLISLAGSIIFTNNEEYNPRASEPCREHLRKVQEEYEQNLHPQPLVENLYFIFLISLLLPFAIIRITGHKGALRIVDEPSRQARLPRYHHGH